MLDYNMYAVSVVAVVVAVNCMKFQYIKPNITLEASVALWVMNSASYYLALTSVVIGLNLAVHRLIV